MIPWAGESPRALPDTQDSASFLWHLYRIHPACFADCAFSQEDLADIKVFRESISRLPKDEILKIVTGIQMCIDDCSIDPASASQRLKLLQDISTSSGIFPRSYWISDVTKRKKISAGGEATVYLGHHNDQTVVVREFHFVELDEVEIEHMAKIVIREIIAHWQLRHSNIISVIGIYRFDGEPLPSMILQRAEHSSAMKYLQLHPDSRSFLKLLLGLFEGIHYLHTRSPPIIHGDLHDRNVLVSCTGDCLLCDFGLSRIRHEISRTRTVVQQGGCERFVAPEISSGIEGQIINEKSDIYSLAMTIYALGTRSLPFAHIKRDAAACRAAREGERPNKHDSLGGLSIEETAHLWPLMENMWNPSPQSRPTVSSARDEIMKTSLICLELATAPVATLPTCVQPSTSATPSHGLRTVLRQLPTSSNMDPRTSSVMSTPGAPVQDHRRERTSEAIGSNIYQGQGPSALLSPDHSYMGKGVSVSVATSVIDACQELAPRNVKRRRLHDNLEQPTSQQMDYEDEWAEDWHRNGRGVPGPGPDVDVEMHNDDRNQDQEMELHDRNRERDLDGGRDVGKGKMREGGPDRFTPSFKPMSPGRPSSPRPSPGGRPNQPSYDLNNTSNSVSSVALASLPSSAANNDSASAADGSRPASSPPIVTRSSPPPPRSGVDVTSTATTSNLLLTDSDLDHAAPEPKIVGVNWRATFNPRVPRMLDISWCCTIPHESVVCCVRFSADGKYIAMGCNRTAQIYNTKTGSPECVLVHEPMGNLYIRSVCFSQDGKLLATGMEDRQIRIWDIAKREIRHLLRGHTQEVFSIAFSPDDELIVSGSGDGTVRIWDLKTCACKTLTILEPGSIDVCVTSVAISPDSRWVAAGSLDMIVRVWDVKTGALVERLRGHKDSVYSVVFGSDGRGLVSGSLDKSVKYWDITPMIQAVAINAQSGSGHVQLRQDGVVASCQLPLPSRAKHGGGEMGSTCTVTFTGHKDSVLSVAVSPDGAWIVSGSKDRGVRFWNPRDGQAHLSLQGHKNSVMSVDLSPAGGLLATGGGDRKVRVWRYNALLRS